MNIKQEKIAGYSKNIFMFEFPKKNFGGIDYGQFSKSPPCAINNLMWRILITKVKADISKGSKDSLGIYLECLGKSKLWSCFALVRFTLVSQKPDVNKDISLEFKHLFSAVSVSQGYHNFITWDKVTNAEYGYINYDMIIIRAYVEADSPKNMSTLDYNMNQPQAFDDWLSLFENKLNDKIVRRISEEIKTVNEKMRGFGKLSEEIKALNKKMERVHNRGVKLMSEFLIKCLKVVIASFHSKMDSLKLEDFHTEMVSVLEELRRIRSVEIEDKANEKSRDENEANSSSESEFGAEDTEEAKVQCEKKEETETDCEIIEEKVHETITISSTSSESDDDESISKNASCKDTEENEVVPKPAVTEESTAVSALKFFKTLVSECRRESSKCCLQRSGCGSRVCGGYHEVDTNKCSEVGSSSVHCSVKAHPKCCEPSSQLNRSCSQVKIEPKCLKRKLENNNCSRSSASTDPPKKSKCLKKDTVKDASDDDSDDTTSTSSESSQSSSTDDKKSLEKRSK